MRNGKYSLIPQRPADYQQLWDCGEALSAEHPPEWATVDNVTRYRCIGRAAWSGSSPPEDYLEEVRSLTDAGVIHIPGSDQHRVDQFYIRNPNDEWYNEAIWSVAIYQGQSPLELSPLPGLRTPILTRNDVTDIPAAFVADPFLIKESGRWYLFVEVMNIATGKGDIALATSDDLANWQYERVVLCEPFHLSYPQVFRWRNDYFMIPESHQAAAVRLYRAKSFPFEWSHVADLLRGPYLADPTVFQHEGKWWMFVDTSDDLRNDRLELYFADELVGPWQKHRASPIVDGDANLARPGGRVVQFNGNLIRFAQGCLPLYGSNVSAFEISKLTPSEYVEKRIGNSPLLGATGSGWNAHGMHHVDAHEQDDGWIAAVDGWFSPSLPTTPGAHLDSQQATTESITA